MSLFENCKLAISSLQKPEQTKQANQWLIDFSKLKEAWEVCDLLLCETSRPHRFFGSITLYGKIQRDLNQLSHEQVQSLLHRLIQHVLSYSNESNLDIQSGRYVCLSIAAAVVQLNVHGIVQQVLSWLNPIVTSCPLLLLELLVALPEECFNYHTFVSDEYRDNFSNELSQSVNEILNFLFFLSQKSEPKNLNQILKCLEMWIIYTELSSTTISAHSIFTFLIQCLNIEDLFEHAIDVLISICRKYAMEDTPNIISTHILPRVLQLQSLWDHQIENIAIKHENSSDEDLDSELNVCRAICRVVTEVAESLTTSYMISDTNEEQQQLLYFLVKCASFKYEFTISRIPLKFFYEFALAIKNIKYNKSIISVNLQSRMSITFPILIETVISQMMLPNAVIAGERKMSDTEEDKRLELVETIVDCSMAIGASNCIQSLCLILQQEINKGPNWSTVESILFAATSILCDLRREDNHLCSQLIMFIGTLPDLPGIKLTTVAFIGKSAGFLRENDQYLPSLLSYLCKCLVNPFTALEATKAITNISRNCSSLASFPKEEIFSIFQQNKTAKFLTLESESYLVEALCYIISSLPPDIQSNVLEHQLCNQLLTTFQSNLQNSSSMSEKTVICDIDLITTIYRYINLDSPDTLISTFLKLQPLLVRAMEIYPTERICEKCCRCYKYVMKSINSSFGPYVPVITAFISDSFAKMPYSAFIYSAAVCLSCFVLEDSGKYIHNIYQMLFHISEKFLSIMNSLEAFEKKPDLVEEFFYFIARALEFCPDPLINSPFITTFIEAAITGLQLKHRESHKAILCFFERLFQVSQHQSSKVILSSCASPVIKCLVQSLAGTLPAYALDENNGSIADTLWIIKTSSSDFTIWIQESLTLIPENKQRIAMYSKFHEITTVDSKYEFSKLIKDFEFRCREKELIT